MNVFEGLLETNTKDWPNRTIFKILDVRNKGVLSIMDLMNIFNNLDRNTLLS